MALEHDAVRLTPEQRDRVLDLAARLQARHESTIAVDDLAHAAAEAGIDARFVHEAAHSLTLAESPSHRPVPSRTRDVALSLVGGLAILNALLALSPIRSVASTPLGVVYLFLAGTAAFFGIKGRLPFWAVPVSILATLFGTRLSLAAVNSMGNRGYEAANVNVAMLIEATLAVAVGIVTVAAEHFGTFRPALSRTDRANDGS